MTFLLQDALVTRDKNTERDGVATPSFLPQVADPELDRGVLEHLDFNSDVSFAALVAFVTVDELGHYGKAAKFLNKQQQGLRQHIRNLEDALHVRLLDTGPGGTYRAVGRVGLELRERARLMVYQYGAISRLGENAMRIRYLSQHGFFMSSVEVRLDGIVDLQPLTLGDEDRSVTRFHDDVIVPLAAGMIDLVIGFAPDDDSPPAELIMSHRLFTSRHEAMVPADDPREEIEVAELVAEGMLLVPPIDTRSREQLEVAIAKDVPDDPGPEARVKRESYGTEALIQYGLKGLGTVVLPSGMAHVFYNGNDHGGPATAAFKWIPVRTAAGEHIFQDVYALMRRARDRHSDPLAKILKLIRQEVADRGLDKAPAREY